MIEAIPDAPYIREAEKSGNNTMWCDWDMEDEEWEA